MDDEGLKKWALIKPHTRIITKLTVQPMLLSLAMTFQVNRFLMLFLHTMKMVQMVWARSRTA